MGTWIRHAAFLLAIVLLGSTSSLTGPVFANDAAQALAERFAGGTQPATEAQTQNTEIKPPESDVARKEEAEILQRARSEAAEREHQAAKHTAQIKAAKAQAEATVAAHEAEQARLAAQQAQALLAAERQAQAKQPIAAVQPPPQTASQISDEQKPEAGSDEVSAAEQADREREVSELATKLKRVREARPAGEMGLGVTPEDAAGSGTTAPPAATGPLPVNAGSSSEIAHFEGRFPALPVDSVRNATSVTILLVMQPGTTGIRIGSKTADPVLCLDSWCYISTGTDTPARLMGRGAALGPINTLGLRAGACRQSLTCVYRGLDIASYFKVGAKSAIMQPIDLRYLHHDRRQPMPLTVGNECRVNGHTLQCSTAIKGEGWTAWIVPEAQAVEAGAEALQAALASGLATTNMTRAASLKFSR